MKVEELVKKKWWLIGNPKVEQIRQEDILNHTRSLTQAAKKVSMSIGDLGIGYAPLSELLFPVGEIFVDSFVALGSQRIPFEPEGPYTGGTSTVILKEAGVVYGIIGHQEARTNFGEGPRLNRQVMTAIQYGIVPILCCGEPKGTVVESEEQRKKTLEVELIPAMKGIPEEYLLQGNLTIAYEPGHVIGLDKPANINYIRSGFSLIRKVLIQHGLNGIATRARLIYGGGVNSETINQVWNLDQPTKTFSGENWAGFLVGRSSASPDFFDLMEKWHTKLELGQERKRVIPVSNFNNASTKEMINIPAITPPAKKIKVAVYGVGEVGVGFIASLLKQDNVEVVQLFNLETDAEDIRARIYKSQFVAREHIHANNNTVIIREEVDLEDEIEIDGQSVSLRKLLLFDLPSQSKITKVIRQQEMQVTLASDPKEAADKLRDDVDVVFFTVGGLLKERALLEPFLRAGAKHVVVSSTSQASDITIIPGFNHHLFNPFLHKVVALASCTGNCGVPIAAIVEEELGKGSILGALIVTAHSKTNSQHVGDKGADPKEEGILDNLILTGTGIKDVLTRQGFFPSIGEAVDAFSIRAPVEKSSLLMMMLQVQWADGFTKKRLQEVFKRASQTDRWQSIVNYNTDHDGSKVYQESTAGAEVFGRLINVWPSHWLTDRQGNRTQKSGLTTLIIPAAYANVYGYGWQAKRMIQYIGGKI